MLRKRGLGGVGVVHGGGLVWSATRATRHPTNLIR